MLCGELLDEQASFNMLSAAADGGINFWDTAEMYPVPQRAATQGASEEILGAWLQRQDRSQHTVMSKVAGPGSMTWIRGGPVCLDAPNITAALDASLERLQTDYIDIYLLHWPDRYVPMFGDHEYNPTYSYSATPLEQQVHALQRAQQQGKIRRWGVSNETAWGLTRMCCAAAPRGGDGPVAIQNAYSLLCRTFDSALAECCDAEGVQLLAYSPLAMGLLSGKYELSGRGWVGPEGSRLMRYKGRYAEAESRYGPKPNVAEALEAYANIAREAGISLAELAIRWVLHRPLVSGAVVGASSRSQLTDLLQAAEKRSLPGDVLDAIDRVHLLYPSPCP